MNTSIPRDPSQQSSAVGDMDPTTFRRYGQQMVEWIASYLDHVGYYPVLAKTSPGELHLALPSHPPLHPEPMEAILSDVDRLLLPAITHWNAPGYMAYFGITASGPGILAEMLMSALNVIPMLWHTSPAATELEQVTLDWLRQLLGLPHLLFGLMHESTSVGVICALAAVREAIPNLHIRELGLSGRTDLPPLRYYASQEAHSSVEKASIVLGLGQAGLRKIGVDSAFCMDVMDLELAIQEDIARGIQPFAVVATVGTTSTTSIDPLPEIADVCERYGLWLYVEASYGGCAAVEPSMQWVLSGCEHTDTLIINPYKWLFLQLDGSVFYTRCPEILKATFSLIPDYLSNTESGGEEVINFMDYSIALIRRFHALKLWIVLRYFGQEGLAAGLRKQMRLAQLLAGWIEASAEFERLATIPFSVVCFRAQPHDMDDEAALITLNEQILHHINIAGSFFLSHSRVVGRFALRIAIGNLRTTEAHVGEVWFALQEACTDLISGGAMAGRHQR